MFECCQLSLKCEDTLVAEQSSSPWLEGRKATSHRAMAHSVESEQQQQEEEEEDAQLLEEDETCE